MFLVEKSAGAKSPLYYGWLIVAVAFISLAIVYALRYSFTVLSVAIEEEFAWGRSNIHLAFSIMITTYGFSGPVTGALLDKYGPRKLFPAGALFIGLGLIACSQITELWHLYMAYALAAIGMSCLGMVCFGTLVSNWFVKWRGTAWGLAASGTGFGMFFIVGFFLPWLLELYGFRVAYFVIGLLAILIVAPLNGLFIRQRPQDIGLLPDGLRVDHRPDDQPNGAAVSDQGWTLAAASRTFPFWMMTACIFCFTISLYSVMMHQVQHAIDVGFDVAAASRAFGLVGLLSMLGKFCWGAVSDYIGRELAYSLGMLSVVIAILLFMSLDNPSQSWILWSFAFFFGLGYGAAQPLYAAMIADLFQGNSLGKIMGVIVAISGVGSAIGPPLAGYIFDTTGSYQLSFFYALFFVILSAGFAWLAAPRKAHCISREAKSSEDH